MTLKKFSGGNTRAAGKSSLNLQPQGHCHTGEFKNMWLNVVSDNSSGQKVSSFGGMDVYRWLILGTCDGAHAVLRSYATY